MRTNVKINVCIAIGNNQNANIVPVDQINDINIESDENWNTVC